MQRRAAVHFPARLVHLVPGAVCQQQDDCPQVLVGGGPQQVLAQGQLGAWQWGQEELLLIFGPDPALLLLPARAIRQARSQSGGTTEAATPVPPPCGQEASRRKRNRGRQASSQGGGSLWGKTPLCCTQWAPGSSIATTWQPVRNAGSQAPESEPPGSFKEPAGDSDGLTCENHFPGLWLDLSHDVLRFQCRAESRENPRLPASIWHNVGCTPWALRSILQLLVEIEAIRLESGQDTGGLSHLGVACS